MVMLALVTLTALALALSRAGRPGEHGVGLESVAPENFLSTDGSASSPAVRDLCNGLRAAWKRRLHDEPAEHEPRQTRSETWLSAGAQQFTTEVDRYPIVGCV